MSGPLHDAAVAAGAIGLAHVYGRFWYHRGRAIGERDEARRQLARIRAAQLEADRLEKFPRPGDDT